MKKLTIDNMHELQPWIALAGYEDCNANVVTMLMWQYPYPFYFEVHAHFALVCFHIEAEDETTGTCHSAQRNTAWKLSAPCWHMAASTASLRACPA